MRRKTGTDYYTFGSLMPGRQFTSTAYRFGFNGKENDNEVKGTGNQQNYGMRIYDPRLGRFLSVDPLTRKYAMLTPYQFASDRPIQCIDLDGLEAVGPPTMDDGEGHLIRVSATNIRVIPLEQANAAFRKASYSAQEQVTEYELSADAPEFVRVWNSANPEANPYGQWIMQKSDVQGLTPAQIKNTWALPGDPPDMMADVHPPAGTTVRAGIAEKIPEWGEGGGRQFQLMRPIPKNSFTNFKSISTVVETTESSSESLEKAPEAEQGTEVVTSNPYNELSNALWEGNGGIGGIGGGGKSDAAEDNQ